MFTAQEQVTALRSGAPVVSAVPTEPARCPVVAGGGPVPVTLGRTPPCPSSDRILAAIADHSRQKGRARARQGSPACQIMTA